MIDEFNRKLRQQLEQEWADLRKLQAAQRGPWIGLTDKEIDTLVGQFRDAPVNLTFAVEAKLKEKNA